LADLLGPELPQAARAASIGAPRAAVRKVRRDVFLKSAVMKSTLSSVRESRAVAACRSSEAASDNVSAVTAKVNV
jgi:hypothetical protein